MSKTFLPLLLAATVLLGFTSCIGRRQGEPASASAAPGSASHGAATAGTMPRTVETARAVIGVPDATGSFGELSVVMKRLARFVGEELSPGDSFAAFFIKDGIGDTADFLIEPTVFPKPTRRIGDQTEADVLGLKRQMQETLLGYSNARSFKKPKRSDVLQSIAYAGRLLHTEENKARNKWLLIFSDLEDNQRRDVSLNLEGVHVRVFYVPARNDLRAMQKKIADWTERLNKAGAASVDIYDSGQSAMLQHLMATE